MSGYTPIEVDAGRVLAAGITPARCALWAIKAERAGRPDAALRLLDAAAALIRAGRSRLEVESERRRTRNVQHVGLPGSDRRGGWDGARLAAEQGLHA